MKTKTRNGFKTAIKCIFWVVVLAALIFVVGFFAYFTNGFKSSFKDFYVAIDNGGYTKTIMTSRSDLEVYIGCKYRVDIKYTFGFMQDEKTLGYEVVAAPHLPDGVQLGYFIDDKATPYMSEKDMLPCFNIIESDTSFEFEIKDDLPGMLQSKYPDSTLRDVPNIADNENSFITLVVYSQDKSSYIALDILLKNPKVELDHTHVVF